MIAGAIEYLSYACMGAGVIFGLYGLALLFELIRSVVEDIKNTSGKETKAVMVNDADSLPTGK